MELLEQIATYGLNDNIKVKINLDKVSDELTI